MSMSAGSVFVRIAAVFDDKGFRQFEQDHVKAQRAKDIQMRLGGDFDPKSFDLYEKRLDEVKAKVARRDAFKVTLGGDYNPQAFRQYERDLAKAERDTKQTHSRLSRAFSSTAAKAASGFAAAGGITALTVFAKNATGAASDIAESITKNQRLFGQYSKDIEKFSQTSAAQFGISRKAVLEYTGTFGNLFRAFGTSQQKSAGLSTELTKLAADMASFNNTSIEDALEALRSGLVGESEPLRKFGVNLNEGALQAEALSSGLVKAKVDQEKLSIATKTLDIAQQNVAKAVKEHGAESIEAQRANIALERAQAAVNKTAAGGKVQLDAQQKALAAVALATKQTEAAHGDFARTSTGLANQQRILKASLSDTAAKIGEVLMPIALKAAKAFNKLIQEWKAGSGTGGELRDTLTSIGRALESIGGFLKNHTTLVKTAAAAWVTYRAAVIAAGLATGGKALLGRLGVGAAGAAAGGAGSAAGGAAATGGAAVAARFAGPASLALLAGYLAQKLTMTGPVGRFLGTTDTDKPLSRSERERLANPRYQADQYRRTGSLLGATSRSLDSQGRRQDVQLVKYESQRLAMAGDVEGLKRLRKAWDDYIKAFGGKTNPGKETLDELRASMDRLQDRADRLPGGIAANARKLKATLEGLAINFRLNLDKSGDAIHDIREMVGVNMKNIERELGVRSRSGQAAVAENFKLAARSVKHAMKDATGYTFDASKTISEQMKGASAETRKYLAEIARMTEASLKAGGFTDEQAHNLATKGAREADPGRMKRAGGGWIGAPGMVGTDTVPTMLAPGEAVLNRHQQAVVEGYLGEGFLDSLFARVQRPHYMARGGIVPVPGFPGESAASSVIPKIEAIAKRFHLTLTDAYGQGHKSPGHTKFGTAADFAGSDAAMDAAVKYLVAQGYLVGYDGRFGSAAWPGHGPSTVAGGNAHLHVELGGKGGSIGAAILDAIKAPRTKRKGWLGALVQSSANTATNAANAILQRAAASMLSTPVAGGGPKPFRGGGTFESTAYGPPWNAMEGGGVTSTGIKLPQNPTGEPGPYIVAVDPRVIPYHSKLGIWPNPFGYRGKFRAEDTGGAIKGNRIDFLDMMGRAHQNAWGRRKVRVQGAARGGFIQRLAKGGRVRGRLFPSGGSGGAGVTTNNRAVGGNSTAPLSGLSKLQGPRIKQYDDWMGRAAAAKTDYDYMERRFNLTDEEFIKEDGTLDRGAIDARRNELVQLQAKLMDRAIALVQAQKIAARVVATYRTIVERLKGAKAQLTGKGSGKLKAQLAERLGTYKTDLTTWQGNLKAFDRGGEFSIEGAQLDTAELGKTIAELNGTKAQTPDVSSLTDTGTATGAPSTADIAAAALKDVAAFTSARGDLLKNYAQNFTTAFAATQPGGMFSSNPSELAVAGGARAFGAASGDVSLGGGMGRTVNIVNNYQQLPDNTQTWSSQMRFQVEAGV